MVKVPRVADVVTVESSLELIVDDQDPEHAAVERAVSREYLASRVRSTLPRSSP